MVAKKTKTRRYVYWTKAEESELRKHSKARTPMGKLVKLFKRGEVPLRQKGAKLGLSLGHRKRRKKR
jgi:hypothetical protein